MTSEQWQADYGAKVPHDADLESTFKIKALPKTDIWRPNDSEDVFNAPMLYQSMKTSDFSSISVTVFAPWRTQYDQGGIVLAFPPPAGSDQPRKWIKAGIEYFSTEAVLGVVGCDRYSDWSLSPMSASHYQKATFKAVREGDTLWIHAQQEGLGELKPMREIKWAFLEERQSDGDLWVGVYAAKPTQDDDDAEGDKGVEVSFSGLEIKRA